MKKHKWMINQKILFLLTGIFLILGVYSVKADNVKNNITVNTTYRGNLSSSSERQQYYFTLSSAGQINVTFKHENLSDTNWFWKINIYNMDQECVMTTYSAGTETEKTSMDVGLSAGNYYMQVESWSYSSASYTFRLNYGASDVWESEPNDGYGTADSINTNTRYYGAIQSGDDEDYYKFTLSNPGKISINFKHGILQNARTYWNVYVKNEKTEELLRLDVKGTDAECNSAEVGLASGTYYVVIKSWEYSDATYNFQVNYENTDAWEAEPNDGYGTATPVLLNKEYHGASQYSSEKDYYKFTVGNPGKIQINFQHNILNDNRIYWKLYIYDEKTNELLYEEIRGVDHNISTAELGLPAGNYYMVISPYEHSIDTYMFQISYIESSYWETEENDGYGTADSITVGTLYYGALQRSSDNDYYKFHLDQTGNYKIKFNHQRLGSDSTYWRIYVYDAATNELSSQESSGAETSSESEALNLGAGDYYIKINDNNYSKATYSLSVNPCYISTTPTLKAASIAYNKIKLQWNKYNDADGYTLYRNTKKYGTYQELVTINSKKTSSYIDKKVKPGKTYYYIVQPYKIIDGEYSYGTQSLSAEAKAAPAKVTLNSVKNTGSKKATVTWKKQSGITGYEIYMSYYKNGSYRKVKNISKASTIKYTQKKLSKGYTYYFKVRSYKKVGGKKVYGDFSKVKKVKIKK